MTLHTSDGCSLSQNAYTFVEGSRLGNLDCAVGNENRGCAFIDNSPESYGDGFNAIGGGVIAHLWDETGISMWRFSRGFIPQDIEGKTPNPSSWGTPVARFPFSNSNAPGGCTADHFRGQMLVFDLTFCGQWAGNAMGGECPLPCAAYVADPSLSFQSEPPGSITLTLTN